MTLSLNSESVRTEREIVADVLWALIERRLIPQRTPVVAFACRVLGLQPADLAAAQARREPGDAPVALAAVPNVGTQTEAATVARLAKKNPTPTTRRCSKCERVLPRSAFPIKDRRTGTLKSWCASCIHDYQRDRYLAVEHGAKFRHWLQFVVREGDSCVGEDCPKCSRQIAVGDVVRGEARVEHVGCNHRVIE